jgi:hypothetical protein
MHLLRLSGWAFFRRVAGFSRSAFAPPQSTSLAISASLDAVGSSASESCVIQACHRCRRHSRAHPSSVLSGARRSACFTCSCVWSRSLSRRGSWRVDGRGKKALRTGRRCRKRPQRARGNANLHLGELAVDARDVLCRGSLAQEVEDFVEICGATTTAAHGRRNMRLCIQHGALVLDLEGQGDFYGTSAERVLEPMSTGESCDGGGTHSFAR